MVERAYSRGADVRCMVSIVTRDVNALHEPFKPSFDLFGIMQMGQIFKSVGKLESLRRPTEWDVLGRTNAINSVEVVTVIHSIQYGGKTTFTPTLRLMNQPLPRAESRVVS
jgi:hypothetical protein